MKRKFNAIEIDALRAQWRKEHPEEAARRDLKRKIRGDVGYHELERSPDENIVDLPPIDSLSQTELAEVKKEMTALWRSMFDRRQEFLKNRDLAKAALTEEEKRNFKEYILRFESVPGFSMETENLLIEGLKYPETGNDLAEFCFKYLDTKYDRGEKPSSTLWLGIWSRDYVPLDAVRLMIRHDNETGTYHKRGCFDEIWPLVVDKVIKHREKERQQFNAANGDCKFAPSAGRQACRQFFFDVLLYSFQKKV